MTNKEDEIDLLELFAKGILAVKNNIITILVLCFVGSILGLLYYQYAPNVYKSKMLVNSDLLTEDYSKSAIENLTKLIKEKNITSLSQKLNLSTDQASALIAIEMRSTIEKPNPIDPLGVTQIYLNIEVSATDNSIWPQLQNGIITYFQNSEFVRVRVEQRRKSKNQMIEKLDLELTDLEKLRGKIASGDFIQSDKKNSVQYEFDLTKINLTIIELNEKKVKLQNSLETSDGVHLMEGFAIFNKPASPKLILSLAAGISIGLVFSVFVIAFKAIRSMLKLSEEKFGKG